MRAWTSAALALCLTMSAAAHAALAEEKQTLIEQRWYTFDEVVEKLEKYGRVPISNGFITHYFAGEDAGTIDAPHEKLSELDHFYSTHSTVGTYASDDYPTALDNACVDAVSGSLATFGYSDLRKHPERKSYKRYVTGIRAQTYLGPQHNFKSINAWKDAPSPKHKRSLLCEIYEVEGEANGNKYVVYAASKSAAMYDEIHSAELEPATED